jgi:XTP/dITP diphosphohydrolase
MKPLLLATGNAGKLRELRALLASLPIRLLSPQDVGLSLVVEEDGATYA